MFANVGKEGKEKGEEIERLEQSEAVMISLQEQSRVEKREAMQHSMRLQKEQHDQEVEQKYCMISADAMQSDTDPLLLPAIIIPEETQPYEKSEVEALVGEQTVKDAIKERDDALIEVRFYRNMAEKLQE